MNKDKLEELLNMTKLAELVNTKQKDDEKKCNTVLWVLAIVGVLWQPLPELLMLYIVS